MYYFEYDTTGSDKRKKSKAKPLHSVDINKGNANDIRSARPANISVGPPPDLDHIDFQKHLDAWLDNCLRDAPLTSSSSEFLGDSNNFSSHQQQQQQQHLQQQPQQRHHQSHIHKASYAKQRSAGMNTASNTTSASHSTAAAAAAVASQLYGSSAKLYGSGSASKTSETPPARGSYSNNMHDPFGNYQKVSALERTQIIHMRYVHLKTPSHHQSLHKQPASVVADLSRCNGNAQKIAYSHNEITSFA